MVAGAKACVTVTIGRGLRAQRRSLYCVIDTASPAEQLGSPGELYAILPIDIPNSRYPVLGETRSPYLLANVSRLLSVESACCV